MSVVATKKPDAASTDVGRSVVASADSTAPTTAEQGALSTAEEKELRRCETTIDKGRKAFVEVGNALATIRDQRLYRAAYDSFDLYCKDRWDFGRAYASRLIGAAETIEVLLPIGNTLPTTESQCRPLLQFPVEDRPAVWQDVLHQVEADSDGRRPDITASEIEHIIGHGLVGMHEADGKPYARRRRVIKKQRREARQKRRSRSSSTEDSETRYEENRRLDQIDSAALQVIADWLTEILGKFEEMNLLLRKIVPDSHWLRCHHDSHRVSERRAMVLAEIGRRERNEPACPNCGSTEFDEDGDCTACYEPKVIDSE